jgi:ribose 5-phosphate isomerase B
MIKNLKLAIDSDDAGNNLKKILFAYIKSQGCDITDLNYAATKSDAFYPEIGYNLATKIQSGEYHHGILICGTGLGMAMVANKVEGILAGVCHDVFSAERLVKSNNAQIITMGERVIGAEHAKKVIDAWLASEFQGGSSLPKVEQLKALEKKSFHFPSLRQCHGS